MSVKYAASTRLREEIKGLTEQIATAQNENARVEQRDRYNSLLQTAVSKKESANDILSRYPNGLPAGQETEEISDCLTALQTLRTQANTLVFSAREEETLACLDDTFQEGAPTEEVLLAIDDEIAAFADLERESKTLSMHTPTPRASELSQKFAFKRPTQEQLTQTSLKVEAVSATGIE